MVLNRIAQLCEQFDARQGTSLDLNDWMGFLVFDGKSSLLRSVWYRTDKPRIVTSDLAYGGNFIILFLSYLLDGANALIIGGTSFLKKGKDDSGIVHGVVAALRLQGRTMAIPWLSTLMGYSSLAKKVAPFMRYAGERFVQRYKDGNPNGGKDFLYHLVRLHSFFKLSFLCVAYPEAFATSAEQRRRRRGLRNVGRCHGSRRRAHHGVSFHFVQHHDSATDTVT